jgi:hypothetical protein
MLRSEIRSEIFDLPVPSRHGKERQKEERNDSLFSCPIPPVPEMHLLRPREILINPKGRKMPTMIIDSFFRKGYHCDGLPAKRADMERSRGFHAL